MSKLLTRVTLMLAATLPAVVCAAGATPVFDKAAMEKARSAAHAQTALAAAQAKKPGATGTTPGGSAAAEITVNPFRSYPTSCLESPLALASYANNPEAIQANVTLFGDAFSADSGERNYLETDTITVFRLPCADGLSVRCSRSTGLPT